MIFAISRAPISRMFVAQRMADGASYSSVVSAKPACVLVTTSKPSRFNASPSRFVKYTLLSMRRDRKSTRLNSSHGYISYAVFCLKKKKTQETLYRSDTYETSNESILDTTRLRQNSVLRRLLRRPSESVHTRVEHASQMTALVVVD